jgi:transcriptional regulator with PAS, ATPase and Fis domain
LLPEDYERLCSVLDEMSTQMRKNRETLEIHTTLGSRKEVHTFSVNLSVMKHNKNGKPMVIIGATTDITADRLRQQQQKDTMLRYQHIFNSALVDTVSYDEHGFIDNMNEKSSKVIPGGVQSVVNAHISIQSVLGDKDL